MTEQIQRMRVGWIVTLASVILVLDDWAQNLLLPLVPMWYRGFGWHGWQVGTVLGAESAVVLWASPLIGRHLGEPRTARAVAIIALGILGVTVVVYGHAQAYGWWIAARIGQGVAVAASFPAIFVWASACLPVSDRERRLQAINVVTAGGALGTPLISGIMVQALGRPDAFGVMAGMVLGVTGALLLTPMPPRSVPVARPSKPLPRPPLRVGMMWGLVAEVMAGVGLLQTALPLAVAVPLQWSPLVIGVFFFVLGVVFVAPQMVIPHTGLRLVLVVLALGIVLMTVLAFVSPWERAGLAVGVTLSFVPAFVWALRMASAGPHAGEGFGWFESGIATGLLVGTTMGGVLWSWGGARATFGVGALVLAGGMGILIGRPYRTANRKGENQIL